MKKAVQNVPVIEVPNEGFDSLYNKNVIIFATNYIYSGKLTGVNEEFVQLEDAGIVYETGEWSEKKFKDFQKIPVQFFYIQKSAIESFGETNML